MQSAGTEGRRRLAIVCGVVLVLAVWVAFYALYIRPGKLEIQIADSSQRGQPIAFGLQSEEGTWNLSDLRGQVVMVDVWASWCAPCIKEIPELVRLQEEYSADMQIVGLNVETKSWEQLKEFLARHPVNYPIARPHPELDLLTATVVDLQPLGQVAALPTVFLLDRQGRLAFKMVGVERPNLAQALEALIEER